MKLLPAILLLSVFNSCRSNLDEFPFVEPPNPIISYENFERAFADICLLENRTISDVNKAAKNLNLVQSSDKDSYSGWAYALIWEAPKERGWSPLTLKLNNSDIVDELIGDGSGLPTRTHTCVLEAYLAEKDARSKKSNIAETLATLNEKAKALDFETFSKDATFDESDVQVKLKQPEIYRLATSNPSISCSGKNRCSYLSPTKLTLEVVLERIP